MSHCYPYHGVPIAAYLKLVSDSTAEPVSSSDIARQVNLPSTFVDDNTWITASITAARKLIEKRVGGGRAFINQTWDWVLDRFPASSQRLELPLPPLQSTTTFSITYYNSTNGSASLASSDYQIHYPYEQPGFLLPPVNGAWPSTYPRPDAVTIRFVAGYGATAASVPETIKHAIKMTVAHWYENREAVNVGNITTELPLGVQTLIDSNRWGFYG